MHNRDYDMLRLGKGQGTKYFLSGGLSIFHDKTVLLGEVGWVKNIEKQEISIRSIFALLKMT